MAVTSVATGSPLAVKIWSEQTMREALKLTQLAKFMGTSPDSLVQVKDETSKRQGDSIRVGLVMIPTGQGVTGDATMHGNEDMLTINYDTVLIDQARNAVLSAGRISEQRAMYIFREEARPGLEKWIADLLDKSFMNQLAGNTGTVNNASLLQYTGQNATVAPSTTSGNTRILYGNGTCTTENCLSACLCNFKLTNLDDAVANAKLATPAIEPIRTPRGLKYVVFVHPLQAKAIRKDATAGRVTWYDYNKAVITGDGSQGNPIGNPDWGSLGEYNNVIIHEDARVPISSGSGSTGTQGGAGIYRAIFCGRQAALMGFGRDNYMNRLRWDEELFDYGAQAGIAVSMIFGVKKSIFNSIDFGTTVISSYAS